MGFWKRIVKWFEEEPKVELPFEERPIVTTSDFPNKYILDVKTRHDLPDIPDDFPYDLAEVGAKSAAVGTMVDRGVFWWLGEEGLPGRKVVMANLVKSTIRAYEDRKRFINGKPELSYELKDYMETERAMDELLDNPSSKFKTPKSDPIKHKLKTKKRKKK